MPLIPLPDVPDLPGVPALPRIPTGPLAIGGAAVALATAYQGTQGYSAIPSAWQIADTTGNALITPDSVIEFEYRGEMKVAAYPVEQGGFASYNKVYVPFDARMICACNGNGAMTREQFLAQIELLRSDPVQGLQSIAIITPDEVYQPCNLVHVDYRREARSGVSLILAQLWFQEIRPTGTATLATAQPSGASAQNIGQAATVSPTAQQSAAYSNTAMV